MAVTACGSGGTGRHTILRGWRRKAWGFKSPLPHHTLASGNPSESGFRSVRHRTQENIELMIYVVTTVHILVCFFIIVVVLLQSGKSGDISAAFGGQGSQTAFGPRGAASALSKATTWSAVAFMVTSITLSVYASKRGGPGSVLQGIKSQPVKTQPAKRATPPANPPTQK